MSYKLFTDSIQTLSDLESFCKVYKYENESKYIYSYDKNKMDITHPSQYLYRSIVVHNGQIVSFSSPKMIHPVKFSQKYNDEDWNEFDVSPYIEGTMINLYYDNISNKWEMATKRMLGGMNRSNNDAPTFRDMFNDICDNYCKVDIQELLNNIQEQVLKVNELHNKNRRLCFSFVMGHPLNNMITTILSHELVLTNIFSIGNENNSQVVSIYDLDMNQIFDENYYLNTFKNILTNNHIYPLISKLCDIRVSDFPEYKNFKGTFLDLVSQNLTRFNSSRHGMTGYVFKNKKTNERTKMFTNSYRYYKMIKGNYLRHIDRFIEYSREPATYNEKRYITKLDEFLGSFPEYYNIYNYYYQSLCSISNNLLKLYKQVNIYHTLTLNECDIFKQHLYKLHGIYLNEIKYNKNRPNYLVLNDVYYYVINLPINNVVYLLRQHGVDV